MANHPDPHLDPTERELAILKVLWDRGEATVREVWEELARELPIVQNTVQAFLRTMEQKGLVRHRTEGRSFIYRSVREKAKTTRGMLSRVLQHVFDGAVDQLVEGALSLRRPTRQELEKLKTLVAEADSRSRRRRP
ncbi:MAG: BlaI/MecI/CopY family transcriptional regulator [Planctomycetota bacterium]